MSESAAPRTVIAQIVATMPALAGSHPGFRPVHAKGIVCSGTFRGAPQARDVSRAARIFAVCASQTVAGIQSKPSGPRPVSPSTYLFTRRQAP